MTRAAGVLPQKPPSPARFTCWGADFSVGGVARTPPTERVADRRSRSAITARWLPAAARCSRTPSWSRSSWSPCSDTGCSRICVGFWAGVGVVDELVEPDVLGAVAAGVVAALVVLCVVDDAAEALVIPAAAPAVASAPATMVAPSTLEMVIGSDLLGSIDGVCTHRAGSAKSQQQLCVGVV